MPHPLPQIVRNSPQGDCRRVARQVLRIDQLSPVPRKLARRLNNIEMSHVGTFETCPSILRMSVHRGRPEVAVVRSNRRDDPTRTLETSTKLSLIYLRLGLCDSDASERGDLPDVSDGCAAARGLGQ